MFKDVGKSVAMKIQEERKVVRLKKPILACAIFVGAALGLQATPVCPTTGTYATLQALGSCTIADKTFSGFTYSDSAVGAVPVTQTNLTYTVIDTTVGSTTNVGFLFGVALTAGPASVNDLGIGYTVTTPTAVINDAAVTMAGIAVGTGASASIAETICPGHTVAGCLSSLALSTYYIAGTPPTVQTSDEVNFSPVATVGVLKDVDVLGGSGLATISLFSDTVSESSSTPEPGYYGVLAGGLGAVLMFARRRKKTA